MVKKIITIGRQYGSGGREIGRRLAQRLGVPYYDKKLIELAAEDSGIDRAVMEHVDETAASALLYGLNFGALGFGSPAGGALGSSINDKVFFAEAERIKRAAEEGPCVIVGRCADYVLRERSDVISVFIHAALQDRVDRAVQAYGEKPARAEDVIHKIDKMRANYYNYYSSFSRKWSSLENYTVTLNTSAVSLDTAVDVLALMAQR